MDAKVIFMVWQSLNLEDDGPTQITFIFLMHSPLKYLISFSVISLNYKDAFYGLGENLESILEH